VGSAALMSAQDSRSFQSRCIIALKSDKRQFMCVLVRMAMECS
jgi:hypothetical protein